MPMMLSSMDGGLSLRLKYVMAMLSTDCVCGAKPTPSVERGKRDGKAEGGRGERETGGRPREQPGGLCVSRGVFSEARIGGNSEWWCTYRDLLIVTKTGTYLYCYQLAIRSQTSHSHVRWTLKESATRNTITCCNSSTNGCRKIMTYNTVVVKRTLA